MLRFLDRAGRDQDRHDEAVRVDEESVADELVDSDLAEEELLDDDENILTAPPARHLLVPAVAAVVLAIVGVLCLAPLVRPEQETSRPARAAAPALRTRDEAPLLPPAASKEQVPTKPPMPSAPPAVIATPTAVASAAPEQAPEDLLAGPVSDQVLQDLLLRSLPAERSITDAALLESSDGQALLTVAWDGLAQDVEAGGWTQTRQQASAVLRRGRDDEQHHLPVVVDVVFMWAATSSSGEPTERELSQVQMSRGSGAWTVSAITDTEVG